MKKAINVILFCLVSLCVLSQEKIANGTFDSASGWTLDAAWSITGGVAVYDFTAYGHIRQTSANMVSPIENGKRYILTFDISVTNPSDFAYIRIYSDNISIVYKAFANYYDGSHQVMICTPSSGNGGGIDFYAGTYLGSQFTLDNVSLVECAAIGDDPYYVATTGNDAASGDIDHPWQHIQRAFDVAGPGDTVYFRGGVYNIQKNEKTAINVSSGIGNNGELGNPISYIGYPSDIANGDSIIFDFSLRYIEVPNYTGIEAIPATAAPKTNSGLAVAAEYLKFSGFTIRNVFQKYRYVQTTGFSMSGSSNITVERVVLHDVSGHGFYYDPWWASNGKDSTLFRNCDAYNCVDSFSVNVANYRDLPTAPQAGTWGNGFMFVTLDKPDLDTSSYVQIIGCRAWHNADEGMNISAFGATYANNFWSFSNGYHLQHDVYDNYTSGNGYKINGGYSDWQDTNIVQIHFNNNLAAFNYGYGYSENNNGQVSKNRNVYNNTMFRNLSYGMIALNQGDTREYGLYKNIYRNNLSYANTYNIGGEAYMYVNEYNSWNAATGVTVTNDDFVLIDSTLAVAEMKAPRKADGSLPDISFLRLASSSDLIDSGVDVGLSYSGSAPDLGWYEYGSGEPSTATDITAFSFTQQTGAATINTTNHTVSIEVAYGTSLTSLSPSITVSYGASIDPPGGTARDFTSPVTYTVTAEDATTTQVWTVTVTVDSAPATSGTVVSGDDWVVHEGKIVKI